MSEPLQKIIANRYGGRDLPVILVLPDGGRVPLSSSTETEIIVRTWRALKALASPELGRLARAYVNNEIDFTGASGIALLGAVLVPRPARRAFAATVAGLGCVGGLVTSVWLYVDSANGHRVVSDAFYRLWLDPRMIYSSAYFSGERESLADAQARKLDHICRKLRLAPGESFLDIGCGWGGLLFWAAQHYGVEATGITLSQHQFDHVARDRRARAQAACG
jgi:cyclopropane-fatty-acyl-phospholipid synthase